MGGVQEFEHWLDLVQRDLGVRAQRIPQQTATQGRSDRANAFADMARALEDGRFAPFFNTDEFRRMAQNLMGGPFVDESNEKANQKAKDLFVAVAGREAFDLLEAGKHIQLRGSVGGDYELRKKASFCIRRPKDGANLCAIVPGVPMYDHLLGIKLMVEHDEDRFLKTANVAGGAPPEGEVRRWIEQHRRQMEFERESLFAPEARARRAERDRAIQEAIREASFRVANPPIIYGFDRAADANRSEPVRFIRSSVVNDPDTWLA